MDDTQYPDIKPQLWEFAQLWEFSFLAFVKNKHSWRLSHRKFGKPLPNKASLMLM
jgi:hypothetical protein